MITQSIKSLWEENEKLSKTFAEVVVRLPGLESPDGSLLEINLDTPIPDAYGSISDCHGRIEALLGIVRQIAKLKPVDFLLVPKNLLVGLGKPLQEIDSQLGQMLRAIDQVKSDGGLREIGEDHILHSVSQQAHPSINLRTYYQTADNHVDVALNTSNRILSIVNPKSYDPFSGALVGIRALEAELQVIRTDVVNLRKDARAKTTQIKTQANTASTKLSELEAHGTDALKSLSSFQDEAQNHVADTAKGKGQITELLANIGETQQQANTLKTQVDAFNPTFEEFQRKLDERNSTFESGKKEFDGLRKEMLVASKENKKYIQESKDTLNWNTASSLASSFSTSAQELEGPLWRSRAGFYVSILLLFGSAAIAFNGFPLLREYIIVPSFPASGNGVDATLVAGLLSALSIKIAVVLPAVLFVGFTSRRHRALFHQHQLYTYKKTVAAALPGFKDHADAHKEAMAAAAFARLLFNPQEDASRDLTRKAGGPGWLSRWLERVIHRSMKTVMAADGKSGSASDGL